MEQELKQLKVYTDCVAFWQSMGIKREDNLIALATIDLLSAFGDNCLESYKVPYYIARGKALVVELASPRYDVNRGRAGWLNEYGF